MAQRYPQAVWDPLGRQTEPRMSRHDIVCVHTMVGSLAGTDAYFEDEGYSGVESTYGVGGSTDGHRDGQVRQWQDRLHTSDANLDGSDRVISIETSDGGDPSQPWSPAQLDALVDLIAWECSPAAHRDCPAGWRCRQVGIPTRLVPDTRRDRRGLAYHRQGVPPSRWHTGEAGWLQPGCERWSTVTGKVCPGHVRIRQFIDIVIPRVQGRRGEEDDMPSPDEVAEAFLDAEVALTGGRRWKVRTILANVERDTNSGALGNAVWNEHAVVERTPGAEETNKRRPGWMLVNIERDGDEARNRLRRIEPQLAEIARRQGVDEQAVAKAVAEDVLAGLPTPAEQATAVAEALPDEQAQDFIDALGQALRARGAIA